MYLERVFTVIWDGAHTKRTSSTAAKTTHSRMAFFAARWQISVISAPEYPWVALASISKLTSSATGDCRAHDTRDTQKVHIKCRANSKNRKATKRKAVGKTNESTIYTYVDGEGVRLIGRADNKYATFYPCCFQTSPNYIRVLHKNNATGANALCDRFES